MNIETSAIIANVLSFVGILTLVGSVVVLIRQLRTQTYQSVQQTLSTIDMCLIEYPGLRKYINGNEPLPAPGSEEYDLAYSMIEMLMDFYEHVLEQKTGMSTRQWESWRQNIKAVYQTCPGMQAHVREQGHRYSPDIIALLTTKGI